MPEADLLVRIGADIADAQAKMQAVQRELLGLSTGAAKAETGTATAFTAMRTHWAALSAAAIGVGYTLNKAFSLAQGAATLEEDTARLDKQLARTGSSAAALTAEIKQLSGGQLSLAESTKLASQGLAIGLDAEKIKTFTQLSEIASDVLGVSMPQAFDQLLTSMATGRTTMLKQIGITVDLEDETKKLAAATGRLAQDVTMEEKARILQNAAMAQSARVIRELGSETASRAVQMTAFTADVKDSTNTIGKGFLWAGEVAFGGLQLIAAGATRFASNSEAAMLAAEELSGKGMRNLGLESEAGAAAQNKFADALKQARAETENLKASAESDYSQRLAADLLKSEQAGLAAAKAANDLADSLLKSADASRVAMKVEEDHARLLKMETEETNRLTEATKILAGLRAEKATAELTRGTPDDALSQIKQRGFSGAPQSLDEVQGLITTTRGLSAPTGTLPTGLSRDQQRIQDEINLSRGLPAGGSLPAAGAFEENRASLMRDLNDLLERTASSVVSSRGREPEGTPFGSGSQVIAPSGGGATFSVGDIIINGAGDPREVAKQVRQELQRLDENS